MCAYWMKYNASCILRKYFIFKEVLKLKNFYISFYKVFLQLTYV